MDGGARCSYLRRADIAPVASDALRNTLCSGRARSFLALKSITSDQLSSSS